MNTDLPRHGPARSRSRAPLPRAQCARRCAAAALVAVGLLAGCASGKQYLISVDGSIPTPLVESLPVRVGVYYSPEFSNYTSAEESLSGDTWQVAFADLQQRYVHAMLTSAFDEVVISPTATPGTDVSYDVLLVPEVENFSFLTPRESGSKFFAVSMRHFVRFIGVDGTDYGAWEINSYGRSRSSFGRSIKDLASEACLDAMRDLATSVIVGLPEEIVNRGIDGIAEQASRGPRL